MCHTEATHVQYLHKNNKCIFVCVCLCDSVHAQPRGQRAGAYINHKLSGSGSCTSNEMVQIKVCWCMCTCSSVCVAALPSREQAEDQCQIWLPSVFLAQPQGHFKKHTHAHLHTSSVAVQHTPLFDSHARLMMHNSLLSWLWTTHACLSLSFSHCHIQPLSHHHSSELSIIRTQPCHQSICQLM